VEHGATARARVAGLADLDGVMSMVSDFAAQHPSRHVPRSRTSFETAFFGPRAAGELIVAERRGTLAGMLTWTRYFDVFWGLRGGVADWLYVCPSSRGLGVPALLVAKVCARIREDGGEFLNGSATSETRNIHARAAMVVEQPSWAVHLSAEAFQVVADLDGETPRDVVQGLPDPELNRVPARQRRVR